jgi:hypothetical protein
LSARLLRRLVSQPERFAALQRLRELLPRSRTAKRLSG